MPYMGDFDKATPKERPLKITYGDDTDFTREELEEYTWVYDDAGIPIDFEKGDIVTFCNYRWAHGRP